MPVLIRIVLLCLLTSASAGTPRVRHCHPAALNRPIQAATLAAFRKLWRRIDRLDGKTLLLADGPLTLGEYLGEGKRGIVYCLADCRRVIKFAKRPGRLED